MFKVHKSGFSGCIKFDLTSVESPAGCDGGDGVVEGPGQGQHQWRAPDDRQPPVAVTELRPDVQGSGDDLVPVYGDGGHRVGRDKHRDALSEWYDGTHEASKRPVI